MDVFKKLDRILERAKLAEGKKQHKPNKPGIGRLSPAERLQRVSGGGFPMATSYHGNTRVNPKTGKKEVYDQAKGWIPA